MPHQLERHGRHAEKLCHPLPLHQLERDQGVPLVHQDQLAAGDERGEEDGMGPRHMEERHLYITILYLFIIN